MGGELDSNTYEGKKEDTGLPLTYKGERVEFTGTPDEAIACILGYATVRNWTEINKNVYPNIITFGDGAQDNKGFIEEDLRESGDSTKITVGTVPEFQKEEDYYKHIANITQGAILIICSKDSEKKVSRNARKNLKAETYNIVNLEDLVQKSRNILNEKEMALLRQLFDIKKSSKENKKSKVPLLILEKINS